MSKETNELYEAAEALHEAGFGVIALGKRSKRPVQAWKEFQKRRADASERFEWFSDHPERNIAVFCGWVSGNGMSLAVLDLDEPGAYEKFARANPELVKSTWVTRTADGYHVYLRVPGPVATEAIVGGYLKAENSYVLAPPSIHPDGPPYTWANKPATIAVVEDLAPLIQLKKEAKGRASKIPERIPDGDRNVTLTSLAGTMRRRGMGEAAILAALRVTNAERCDPPIEEEKELEGIAHSVARYDPAERGAIASEVGWTKALADAILAGDRFAQDSGGRLYRYTEGVYRGDGKEHVGRRTLELLESWGTAKRWSRYRTAEVAEYVRLAGAPLLENRPPMDVLNVLNGLLEVATGELLPHTPEHLSTIQLPVAYDPGADCPAWYKFVEDVFPEDCRYLPFELIAWLMLPDTSLQKAVLLLGSGENGKSRFLQAVKAFLGRDNVAGLSLHKLELGRFATARLVGKLANVCPDLPSAHLAGTSVFKALTGGDLIHAERKYAESFEFENYARLLFSANHPPQSSDSSDAFFRRWLVVPFERTFQPGDPGYIRADKLDAMLADPTELSGVLNRALIALPQVQDVGIGETETMREAWFEFREVTDPVEVWLSLNTIESPELYVEKGDLQREYNRDAKANGRPPMTGRLFSGAVKRWKRLREGQKRIGDRRPKVWYGIGLRAYEVDLSGK